MKKLLSSLLVAIMTVSLAACGSEVQPAPSTTAAPEVAEVTEASTVGVMETTTAALATYENLYPDYILGENETSVTYLNKFGEATTISKNPEKVVVIYNSLLGLWYYMGGESMTKVKGSSNVPEEAKDLVDLGSSYSLSLEAIIAFEPDLIIMSANIDSSVAMAPSLKEMGIETMIIDAKTKSYDRFAQNAYLFSKVLGTEAMYDEKTAQVLDRVDAVIKQASEAEVHPRVAPLFATSKSLSLETDIAQIGEIVAMLGGENIYSEEDLLAEGETRIPFSIEALVTQNPEIILVSTMGDIDSAKENIQAMIAENPVWNEVDAVKNDQVFFLDKDLSVYKPNQRYDEAFLMVAEMMYPALFPTE